MNSKRMGRLARGLAALAAASAPLAAAAPAAGQVLEIDRGGRVSRYDGPAVFSAVGASPISLRGGRSRPVRVRGGAPSGARADIAAAASAADLSSDLIEAVARQESGMRPGLVSRAGAVGEMQLMPSTARSLGVDPLVSRDNYRGGAGYLRLLMRRYDGDVVRVLSAYNAGPGAVDRYGGTPPFRETQAYVAAVLERMGRKSAEEGAAQ